jgi:hypothetical protein
MAQPPVSAGHKVADLDPDYVAAAQFAVDR